jgi:hypothetical protein
MNEVPTDLKGPAAELAEEMRQGKWNHCYHPNQRGPFSEELVAELEKRIPGYASDQYQQSIGFGLFVTR